MQFFCSRCGACLRVPDDLANVRVKCGSCSGVTRTPETATHLHVAEVADPELEGLLEEIPDDELPISDEQALTHLRRPDESDIPFARPTAALDYARPNEPPLGEAVEELAAHLANVTVAPNDGDAGAMVECPHCGSRIAAYVRKCPFCRHPLYGP